MKNVESSPETENEDEVSIQPKSVQNAETQSDDSDEEVCFSM